MLKQQGLAKYCDDPDFVKYTSREMQEALELTEEEMDRAAHRILMQERSEGVRILSFADLQKALEEDSGVNEGNPDDDLDLEGNQEDNFDDENDAEADAGAVGGGDNNDTVVNIEEGEEEVKEVEEEDEEEVNENSKALA